jgi:hypothetical protein
VMSLWEQRALDDVPALAAATYEHWRSLLTPAEARVHDAVVRTSDSEMAAAQARSRLLERRTACSRGLRSTSTALCVARPSVSPRGRCTSTDQRGEGRHSSWQR